MCVTQLYYVDCAIYIVSESQNRFVLNSRKTFYPAVQIGMDEEKGHVTAGCKGHPEKMVSSLC